MQCEDCEDEILPERLKVNPNTTVCVVCQEKREKEGKFKRSHIEISQNITGWQCEDVIQTVIPGGYSNIDEE